MRKVIPAMRPMGNLDTLPHSTEQDRILSHNISRPNGVNPDFPRCSLTDHSMAAIYAHRSKVAAPGICKDLGHSFCGAAGGIFLKVMVRLHDFNIVPLAKGPGNLPKNRVEDVHSYAHTWGLDAGNSRTQLPCSAEVSFTEASSSNDSGNPGVASRFKIVHSGLRYGEVKKNIRACQDLLYGFLDDHTDWTRTGPHSRISAHTNMALPFHCADNLEIFTRPQQSDQALAHSPRSPSNDGLDHDYSSRA
jgi:hypothetical protein